MARRITRRAVLGATAGFLILSDSRSAYSFAANEKMNLALVGVSGRGDWFVGCLPGMGQNLVAMCDVNEHRAGPAFDKFPQAKKFFDFRTMLDEAGKEIDGVVIAVPDHNHAIITMAAMKAGKPVYCEKPLTHDMKEARAIRLAAGKFKVATQMGNQGGASPEFRKAHAIVQAGLLGDITRVYVWNSDGGRGKGAPTPERPECPKYLHWDLWLGPAADRPYHPFWLQWHSWREFATGNLGNWASHTANLAFMSLKLDKLWYPPDAGGFEGKINVEARVSGLSTDVFPKWEVIHYDIPARGDLPPVKITWSAGSQEMRKEVEERLGRKLDWGDAGEKKWQDYAGCLIIGSKGMMHLTGHNATFSMLPQAQFKEFVAPPPTLPRSRGHEMEWIVAAKGGPRALSNFDYAGPLAEFVLLGNLATLLEGKLEFDPIKQEFAGRADANALLGRERRKGWEL